MNSSTVPKASLPNLLDRLKQKHPQPTSHLPTPTGIEDKSDPLPPVLPELRTSITPGPANEIPQQARPSLPSLTERLQAQRRNESDSSVAGKEQELKETPSALENVLGKRHRQKDAPPAISTNNKQDSEKRAKYDGVQEVIDLSMMPDSPDSRSTRSSCTQDQKNPKPLVFKGVIDLTGDEASRNVSKKQPAKPDLSSNIPPTQSSKESKPRPTENIASTSKVVPSKPLETREEVKEWMKLSLETSEDALLNLIRDRAVMVQVQNLLAKQNACLTRYLVGTHMEFYPTRPKDTINTS